MKLEITNLTKVFKDTAAVEYFDLYQIGGQSYGALPLLLILYPVLTAALFPVLYLEYRKTAVK